MDTNTDPVRAHDELRVQAALLRTSEFMAQFDPDKFAGQLERIAAALAQQTAAPSGAVNVVGMPEFDGLMDHIYEYGTAADGVVERANAFARAVLAQYAPQQPAAVNDAMVDRAGQALYGTDWGSFEGWEADQLRRKVRAVLTAALAAQPGGSDNDRA